MSFLVIYIKQPSICVCVPQDYTCQNSIAKGLSLKAVHRRLNITRDGGLERGTVCIDGGYKCNSHASAPKTSYGVSAIAKLNRLTSQVVVENAGGYSCRNI